MVVMNTIREEFKGIIPRFYGRMINMELKTDRIYSQIRELTLPEVKKIYLMTGRLIKNTENPPPEIDENSFYDYVEQRNRDLARQHDSDRMHQAENGY